MYQELADMACNRITGGITRQFLGERPIKALLDPYNPTGSTRHVRFNTSKTDRWETSSQSLPHQLGDPRQRLGRRILPRGRAHPKVRAYVKNHNLGLEVPYRYGSETRKYRPDFIVLVDDGHGPDDLLHLVVEIKGYRREDAKEKKSTMDTYWVPGVNHLGSYGRWAFAEFCEVYQIESDFKARVGNATSEGMTMARPGNTKTVETRPRPRNSVWRGKDEQDWIATSSSGAARAAALHPGEGAPQGADRRPAAQHQGAKHEAGQITPTSSPISTASPRAPTRPSSTSTTRTGPTA
jgi:hypothetical protein